jgi:hypothetical protein
MHDETTRRGDYQRRNRADEGEVVCEAAVGPAYGAAGAPDYAARTRRTLDAIREVVLDLDTQRREIRRLGSETREILARLAA